MTTPRDDFAGYLSAYVEEMTFGDEDPGVVLDRYHTPDIAWFNDGLRLDRERLIAHARPVRKNVTSGKVRVQEALRSGDRIAARYVLDAVTRGREISTEIYMFGELAPDGRLRRVDQITRTLSEAG